MGQGVPEPRQESVMGVKAALIPWDDAPNLRDNCHFPICGVIGGPYLCVLGPSVMSSSTLRILGLCGAGLVGFRRRERRRGGPCGKRFRLVRPFLACANRPVRRQQLLLRRRVERPRLVSVRQRVERRFWLDRPLQPQHLWRLRDPAPPSWRRRFPSPGAEPRLPTARPASAARRPRRSGVSYFRRRPRLASRWRRRRSHLA